MTKLRTDEVKKISHLANLPLSENEEMAFSPQLSKIVDYFDELSKVPTDNIEPTFSPIDLQNVQREDIAGPSLSQEDALKNAENTKNGMFVVSRVNKNE